MIRKSLLALAAVTTLAFAGGAQAANVDYTLNGVIESGPLAGMSFSGLFSFDDSTLSSNPDSLPVTALSLSFNGHTYSLADANPDASVSFDTGMVVGVDATWGTDTSGVLLSSAFGSPYLGDTSNNFGSYTVTAAAAVPEPSSWMMGLAGLAMMGAVVRRRTR